MTSSSVDGPKRLFPCVCAAFFTLLIYVVLLPNKYSQGVSLKGATICGESAQKQQSTVPQPAPTVASPQQEAKPSTLSRTVPSLKFQALLKKQAKGGLVTYTLFDTDYQQFAKPWNDQLKRLGMDNAVMVAMDDEAYKRSVAQNLPVVSFECAVYDCKPMDKKLKTTGFHYKMSPLRAIVSLGYNVFVAEMDIILARNPFTTVFVNGNYGNMQMSLGNYRTLGPDMFISAHCYHKRINIGYVIIRNSQRTRDFFELFEENWIRKPMWDQVLWDAMLLNFDRVGRPYVLPKEMPTFAKISTHYATEYHSVGGEVKCSAQFGSLTHVPCEERFSFHFTDLEKGVKLAVMCQVYGEDASCAKRFVSKPVQFAAVKKALADVCIRLPRA